MADTLSCQRETLHSQELRSIKKSIDSDHGIYRYTAATSSRCSAARRFLAARGEGSRTAFRISFNADGATSPICSNLSSRHTQQSRKVQPQPISLLAWRPQDSHCRSNDPRRFPKILPPCRQLDMGRVGGPRGDSASHRLVRVSALAELLHRGDPSIGEGRHNGSIASPTTIFVGAEAVCQFRA